ncbi:DUF4430 domain-containing protein [Thalassobacillus pellis]|uniref:DUF4430 domain-containing protein n=1 Tax=Thalassobacillus pellis TaxID=748008 RepID=UPI0019615F9F|nr:DUF4430 domain-containing protein [Thalassobacillus pellis]MBM7552423.1 hypothetical protein [Thalassobacillus pellis]
MGKWYRIVSAIFLSLGILAGCQAESPGNDGQQQTEQQAKEEFSVQITISQNNGEKSVAEKELEVKEGTSLMKVLKENFEGVKEKDGFITQIEGIKAKDGEQKAWFFTINGETAKVGAKEYELKEGDEVVFDFHKWE